MRDMYHQKSGDSNLYPIGVPKPREILLGMKSFIPKAGEFFHDDLFSLRKGI